MMELSNSNDIDQNYIEKVVSVQNEASIIAAASDEVKKWTQKSFEKSAESSSKSEFQKQVESGEITPFQALEKNKNATNSNPSRTFNKPSELLDLEKYLLQQAQLTRDKKAAKRNKSSTRDDSQIPQKQTKLNTSKSHVKIKRKEPSESKSTIVDASNQPASCEKSQNVNESDSEYIPSDEDSDEELKSNPKKKRATSKSKCTIVNRILDDGDEDYYRQRVEDAGTKEPVSFHKLDNLFKVPNCIWKKLYKYQRVSVRWLWELHSRGFGGLLGDEIGLGKTVQVLAFLASLDFSDLLSDGGRFRGLGPTLIVCPATLLEQWISHLHEWWPTFRVVLLHQSSTYQGDPDELIRSLKPGGILITSYTGVLNHKDALFKMQWHYVILDEGHKIRNPEAKVTQMLKKFSTPHRLLLTGSPMQNSLKELWSLFDFILPGKLGTLAAFMEHCAMPITRGGYSNASALQEATALQVATMLKDAITPYMLRRTKFDVQHHVNLPEKNEQVLFCSLTEEQKTLYKQYLSSDDVSSVIHEKGQKARLLTALTVLRKICNHPDLYLYTKEEDSDEDLELNDEFVDKFGHWKRSGKMTVVRALLKIWKKQGHRVLLFTQSRQMMHILEALLQREGHTYLRMDGTTPVSQRQQTITKFNDTSAYFVFLLTTKVGGLGINLTGADRVIIYDPDWNPATDAQARERAWRIGQDKNVTIYRLITAGSIEEKIYHRQIFKLLLSSRVLEDPRQRRLFRTSDLTELFNYNEPVNGDPSESDQLFRESRLNPLQPSFSRDKIKAMRELASTLSKKIGEATKKERDPNEKSMNEIPDCSEAREPNISTKRLNIEDCGPANDINNSIGTSNDKGDDEIDEKQDDPDVTKRRRMHQKKKRKKSKDAEESALFEGERVSCLIGRRLGASQQEESLSNTDDHYVLCKLFSKAAVNSVFQHESVLANAKDLNQKTPLERVAHDAAQESMNFVRQSRKWCWMPNWDTTSDE